MNPITQDMGGAPQPAGADSLPDPLVRAEHYRVLAAAFAYPDAEELATLLAEAEQAATAAGQSELASFSAGLLTAVEPGLAGEYNRLFAQSVACSPYETSYVAADKGVQLGRLAALMEAFCVRSRGAEHESPDHIGSELEFMAFLCLKEATHRDETSAEGQEAYAAVRQAQALFLQEHVARWAGVFADGLRHATRLPFYALLAELLPTWLAQDLAKNGWPCEPLVPRRHLPLLQPDGSLRSTIATGDVDDDAMSCPMASPESQSADGEPVFIG